MTKLEELKAARDAARDDARAAAADAYAAEDAWYVARAAAADAYAAEDAAYDAYEAELEKKGEKQND